LQPLGKAEYYGWFELLPEPSARLKLQIRPNDKISASVQLVARRTEVVLRVGDAGHIRGRGSRQRQSGGFDRRVRLKVPGDFDIAAASVAAATSRAASPGSGRISSGALDARARLTRPAVVSRDGTAGRASRTRIGNKRGFGRIAGCSGWEGRSVRAGDGPQRVVRYSLGCRAGRPDATTRRPSRS